MTIEFTLLTVLIGANACGKTSILQALDFLWSVARQDISVFLEQRDWMFSELKSQLTFLTPAKSGLITGKTK
jgi:predicted ATP-dependent endonuclease of OLD family